MRWRRFLPRPLREHRTSDASSHHHVRPRLAGRIAVDLPRSLPHPRGERRCLSRPEAPSIDRGSSRSLCRPLEEATWTSRDATHDALSLGSSSPAPRRARARRSSLVPGSIHPSFRVEPGHDATPANFCSTIDSRTQSASYQSSLYKEQHGTDPAPADHAETEEPRRMNIRATSPAPAS
jgi:hypothetical protein